MRRDFPKMRLSNRLTDDSRRTTYGIIFGIWFVIAAYAVMHDQVIVRIAPEHFTDYHDPVPGVDDPRLLAAIHALAASVVKGLPFGILCVWIGRRGGLRRIPVKALFLGTLLILVLTEVGAIAAGFRVHQTGTALYPGTWYPDHTLPILVTQTVQITCYLSAFLYSLTFFVIMHRWRRRGVGTSVHAGK